VERELVELPRFPAETRRHLLHILLSHHGEYEFGSPRRPKTPEALLIAAVDNLDAKLGGMLEAIAAGGDTGEAWTEYTKILDRPVYRRRPPGANGESQ
jgi:3'-5' exoribonuclease